MTLSTNVYVLDPVDVSALFAECQRLLEKYDDRPGIHAQVSYNRQDQSWEDGVWAVRAGNEWTMANEIGQGLPAILDISYRPGVPLRTPEQATACEDHCDELCSGKYHDPACWADVDFDTSYGYRDSRGMGCGDLHATLVAELGKWLDERGIRWEWRNEFTSEVHGGEDRYRRLIDLCSGGFEATAWFTTSVLPAIASKIAEEGGAS